MTRQSGAVVDMLVGVSDARAQALEEAGIAIPKMKKVRALIDTGATSTCLDPIVFTHLGLHPTGSIPMPTPSTGPVPIDASTYDVSIIIPAGTPPYLMIENMPVSASELYSAQGFHALLGRDILERCLLDFNGGAGFFTLAY